MSDTPYCYNCGSKLDLPSGPVGRGDYCEKCNSDIRVCRNCLHYDTSSYNERREPMAERVVDKTKGNFCDYFSIQSGPQEKTADPKEDALKKLDDLFK